MTGLLESEREAHEAAVQYPATAKGNLRMLLDTISPAGVPVRAYDVQVLEWLAKQPAATCAMIASLIARVAEPVAGFMPMGHQRHRPGDRRGIRE